MPDVAIRPAMETDLPAITDIYNHYIVNTPITFDLAPSNPGTAASGLTITCRRAGIVCSSPKTSRFCLSGLRRPPVAAQGGLRHHR